MQNLDLSRLSEVKTADVAKLTDAQFRQLAAQLIEVQQNDRKENQLLYYIPVSETAEKVHMCQDRYMGIGGGNGACLPLHAPILMADGSWRKLGEIKIGDEIIASDPETGQAKPNKVTNVFRSGMKPVWRIHYSDGGYVDATDEHEIPIYRGSGKWTSKGNPIKARKSALGQWRESVERRGPAKRISTVKPQDIQYKSTELKIPPYLLGALLGDGGLTQMIRFFNVDEKVLNRVKVEAAKLGTELVHYEDCSYGLRNGSLRSLLKELGLHGCNSHTKFIPESVFGLSREDRLQFLAGMIDTDGSENTYVSVSLDLAEGFARVVHSLGGKATVTKRENSNCYGVYWRLNEVVPIYLKHKQTFSKCDIDYSRHICRRVEYLGEMECGDIEVEHEAHCYVTQDYTVVSNSKTDTMLAELSMLATGIFPPEKNFRGGKKVLDGIKAKFRGPIAIRVVVESLTTTLHPIILPKLQWFKWNGVDEPGGDRGHWGWIPRNALLSGSWQASWSEKLRSLRTICFDPENPGQVLGETTWQFMAHTQDASDFASGDFHHILHDELTSWAIWRENEARTMRVGGRIALSFTWPDDPAIPVDWVFDELYEPGQPGPTKQDNVSWFEMWSFDNANLNQDSVQEQAGKWNERTVAARIYGRPIRFSNRVHPLFTDRDEIWCLNCDKSVLADRDGSCMECKNSGPTLISYNHVSDFDPVPHFPTVYLLDPHPRKPHMMMWVQVDTWDDYWVLDEAMIDDEPDAVWALIREREEQWGLNITARLGDPNMLRSPAGKRRQLSWQDEFDTVGLRVDLADDSDVGRGRLNDYLKVDPDHAAPRIHIHPRCVNTIKQMQRYVWDDYKHVIDRDAKQTPKEKQDDFPTMLKYLMNYQPTFRQMSAGPTVLNTRVKKRR